MLFNSYEFIFGFLPITTVGYFFFVHRGSASVAKLWLAACSLFFYGWWNPIYVPLLLGSIGFNWIAARLLAREEGFPAEHRRLIFLVAIGANLSLLGYFKYADFFISNWNTLTGADVPFLHLLLPLGISFYTFQKIAFVTDVYRGVVRPRKLVDYALFVSFFPQLIAGPIVHHSEIIPQFERAQSTRVDWHNMSLGFFQFAVGLFKKVVIADTLSSWVAQGFDGGATLTFFEAWIVALAYTAQLYYDFSGYCDMAMGAARLFNIELPWNFMSPYKSRDIQEFWRRWHATLGRFLRDYVYIPLGGNRGSARRTYANLMATFLIGGLWHGAGWTFVFWGFLHGAAIVVHRAWTRAGRRLPDLAAWMGTFAFVVVAWVFFRAHTWADAIRVLHGMAGLDGITLHPSLVAAFAPLARVAAAVGIGIGPWRGLADPLQAAAAVAASLALALLAPNSIELTLRYRLEPLYKLATAGIAVVALLQLHRITEFLYFQF